MSTDLQRAVVEKLQTLTEEQQREVLDFMEDLERKATPLERLGELADDLLRDVPREVIAQLPVDGAENHDHYLYGARKKDELRGES